MIMGVLSVPDYPVIEENENLDNTGTTLAVDEESKEYKDRED